MDTHIRQAKGFTLIHSLTWTYRYVIYYFKLNLIYCMFGFFPVNMKQEINCFRIYFRANYYVSYFKDLK